MARLMLDPEEELNRIWALVGELSGELNHNVVGNPLKMVQTSCPIIEHWSLSSCLGPIMSKDKQLMLELVSR